MSELSEELEGISAEIHTLVERLDDLALCLLREAVAKGESRRPEIERRITRARNALLRAVPLLRGGGDEQMD